MGGEVGGEIQGCVSQKQYCDPQSTHIDLWISNPQSRSARMPREPIPHNRTHRSIPLTESISQIGLTSRLGSAVKGRCGKRSATFLGRTHRYSFSIRSCLRSVCFRFLAAIEVDPDFRTMG